MTSPFMLANANSTKVGRSEVVDLTGDDDDLHCANPKKTSRDTQHFIHTDPHTRADKAANYYESLPQMSPKRREPQPWPTAHINPPDYSAPLVLLSSNRRYYLH
jgi:hypothetical protein